MDRIIESFEEFKNNGQLNEKKITAPKSGFTRKEIEDLLKQYKDLSLLTKSGKEYFVAPYMHIKGKLEDADDKSFWPIDKDGQEAEIKYKDISYITV